MKSKKKALISMNLVISAFCLSLILLPTNVSAMSMSEELSPCGLRCNFRPVACTQDLLSPQACINRRPGTGVSCEDGNGLGVSVDMVCELIDSHGCALSEAQEEYWVDLCNNLAVYDPYPYSPFVWE